MTSISSPTPNNATGGISTDTSRLASTANLKQAGEKFEAMFDGMMLKSMRQAKLADPLFDSRSIDTFTEMQDAQLAQSMAQHQPNGIGKALTAFLTKGQAGTDFLSRSQQVRDDLSQGDGQPAPKATP